jgi:hypothetical protein
VKCLLILFVVMCAGCASYVTPGGSVRLTDIDRADIAEAVARKPGAKFPATLAIVRVQSPHYKSYSASGFGEGQFSVLTTQELLSDADIRDIQKWPGLTNVGTINRLLLPPRLESLDSLRVAAAKMQADIMLVYTLETSFKIQGRGYGPVSVISLGVVPDRDAYVTSTASAVFTDVRTGYIYGTVESSAQVSGLTTVWRTRSTVDKKRTEAELEAFRQMISLAATTWGQLIKRYR